MNRVWKNKRNLALLVGATSVLGLCYYLYTTWVPEPTTEEIKIKNKKPTLVISAVDIILTHELQPIKPQAMAQLQELSARYNIILVVASDHAKEVDVPGSTSVFRCKEEGKPHIVRHLATYGPLSGYIDTDPGVVKMVAQLCANKPLVLISPAPVDPLPSNVQVTNELSQSRFFSIK